MPSPASCCLRRRGSDSDARRTARRLSRRPLRGARSLPSCAARGCLVAGSKPLSMARPSIDFASRSSGILGDQLAQAGDVGGVGGVLRAQGAACRLRLDVQPLARRRLVAQRHRLRDRFTRADLRVDRRAAGRARHRVDARLGALRRRGPPLADRAATGTPDGNRWRRSARCTSSAIAMSGSSSSACVHDRSDSWNQNE